MQVIIADRKSHQVVDFSKLAATRLDRNLDLLGTIPVRTDSPPGNLSVPDVSIHVDRLDWMGEDHDAPECDRDKEPSPQQRAIARQKEC